MKKYLIHSGLILFGIFLSLILSEVIIRVFFPQDRMITWLEMHPTGFMMNQSGGEAFQEFEDRTAVYSFNDFRLRGTAPFAGSSKILALGDSFTFGLLLDEKDTYVHHLQDTIAASGFDSAQVLNGGVGGAGLADWPGWLNEFGKEIKPSYVLYFLNTDDLERALSKNLFVLRNDSLIKSQRWKPRNFFIELGQKNWYRTLQRHSDLSNLIVKVFWAKLYFEDITSEFDSQKAEVPIPEYDKFTLESDYSLQLGQELFQKLNNWCVQNNCELIVTTTGYFPSEKSPHTARLYDWLKGADTDYLFFDNSPCVDSLSNGDLSSITIPNDTHPNEEGSRIIAECTWNALSEIL